jgi:putative acetyltransferase
VAALYRFLKESFMLVIRAETAEDIPAVRRVNELAFGQPDEADLVDALRATAQPHISLVAVSDGRVVGHIFFSPVTLEAQDSILGLAPMAVLPEYQRQGIGSRLVREGLKECQRIGCDVVVVLGHPEYYPRFGFVPASRKGLRCEYPVPDEVFMVAELKPNALTGRGLVKYRPEFGGV